MGEPTGSELNDEQWAAEMDARQSASGGEADVAWRLFEHIREKDPASVGSADDAIAVFKQCMAAIRDRPSAWAASRQPGEGPWDQTLDDDLPPFAARR